MDKREDSAVGTAGEHQRNAGYNRHTDNSCHDVRPNGNGKDNGSRNSQNGRGMGADDVADSDFFSDPDRVESYRRSLVETRMKTLGLSKDEAEAWTEETIKDHRAVSAGASVSRFDKPTPPALLVVDLELSEAEQEYWNRRVTFRIDVLGFSREIAEDWTRHEIERGRQLSDRSDSEFQVDGYEVSAEESAAA